MNRIITGLLLLAAVFCLFMPARAADDDTAAESAGRAAFLPFTVNADRDLSYLREGIRDMLASRLAAEAGVTVIDKTAVDRALAAAGTLRQPADFLALGNTVGAGFVVAGSVTALGAGMSLDAVVYRSSEEQPERFYATAPNQDTVIPAIDSLAAAMADKIFQVKRSAAPPAVPAPAQQPSETASPDNGYRTPHPERAFLTPGRGSATALMRPQAVTEVGGFSKSRNFDLRLMAMDVADVDGDGVDDIVMAGSRDILVFRQQAGRLQQFGRIPLSASHQVHFLSTADLNGDGKAEIYASTADVRTPNSFAVEWRGGDFHYLFQDAPWYVRTLKPPGEGTILAGQRAGAGGPVLAGIFELMLQGGEPVPERRLPVPDYLNLFDFALADLDGNGAGEVVAISQSDRLLVLRTGGRLLWQSSEPYGGARRYIGEESALERKGLDVDSEAGERVGLEEEAGRIYIPQRLVVTDLNGDGLDDVVAVKNISTASRIVEHYKHYPAGEVHGLTWNGLALTELWRTRRIDGYIADFQLRPGPREDTGRLYVGLGLRGEGWFNLGGAESTVLMYELDFMDDNQH